MTAKSYSNFVMQRFTFHVLSNCEFIRDCLQLIVEDICHYFSCTSIVQVGVIIASMVKLKKMIPFSVLLMCDCSDTAPLGARCLGTRIVTKEATGAMIEAEVEDTEVVEVVAGEVTEGLMPEPLGSMWAAFLPGREAEIWKTSSPNMGGMELFT